MNKESDQKTREWHDSIRKAVGATSEVEVEELRKDKARLDWLLMHAEITNPSNCSDSWDTRAAIDAAMKGSK